MPRIELRVEQAPRLAPDPTLAERAGAVVFAAGALLFTLALLTLIATAGAP